MMQLNQKLLKAIEEGREDIFYNSRTWRNKRKEIISRDNNECQMCKEEGRFSKGETVHHIKHLKKFPSLGMTDENLVTVCNHCHNILHPEKNGVSEVKARFVNEERW